MGRPYIRQSVLWHLMEEGTLSVGELCRLIGCGMPSLSHALISLVEIQKLVAKTTDPTNRTKRICSLTPKGIEAALKVQRDEVEFAS